MNLKNMMRKWLYEAVEAGNPMNASVAEDILRACPTATMVVPISNGYLLRVDEVDRARGEHRVTLTFAPTHEAVGEAIIAHEARKKMGVTMEATSKEQFGVAIGGMTQGYAQAPSLKRP